MLLLIRFYTILISMVMTFIGDSNSFSQNCQCVYLTGTQGQNWGRFVISSAEIRYNNTECVLIFITGTEQEVIEMRFEEINLRKRCVDQVHIFPHLKEPIIQDMEFPEETICCENAYNFVANTTTAQTGTTDSEMELDENEFSINTNQVDEIPFYSSSFRIENRHSIFSSDKILGMRLLYGQIQQENAFRIVGKFKFLDRTVFKNDGNLVPTTYCDYQFLPHPINYATENKLGNSLWRNFHSPRYPAKYPDHIKCTYRFVGRPRNRVEVLFDEIYLLTGHSSCLHHTDKITIYDSKIPDKSSIIDVFCNEKPSRRITSSGPNLLIEFEASSNRTSNGFSAKYRFVDIFQTGNNVGRNIISENLSASMAQQPADNEQTSNLTNPTKNNFHEELDDDHRTNINMSSNNKNNNDISNMTSIGLQLSSVQMQSTSSNIPSAVYGNIIPNATTESGTIYHDPDFNSTGTTVRVCPPGIYKNPFNTVYYASTKEMLYNKIEREQRWV